MRILALLAVLYLLGGCTAMLVGGSATAEKQNECGETERKENGREC